MIAGVGAGWLRPEFEALGVEFEARGRLTDEAIDGLRELFAGRGELTSIPARASIPIIVGGSSRAALKRAARLGDGWHPLNLVGEARRRESRATARPAPSPAACSRVLFPPGLEPGVGARTC